jgi:hypothetical protein
MKREYRLPDVILMSRDATDLLESQTTDNCVFVDSDKKGVSFKDSLSDDVETDKRAEYRNIVQLWHPAREQPHCIGSLLCWRLGVHASYMNISIMTNRIGECLSANTKCSVIVILATCNLKRSFD